MPRNKSFKKGDSFITKRINTVSAVLIVKRVDDTIGGPFYDFGIFYDGDLIYQEEELLKYYTPTLETKLNYLINVT